MKPFTSEQRARKTYICAKCNQPIPPGILYRRVRHRGDKTLTSTCECLSCPEPAPQLPLDTPSQSQRPALHVSRGRSSAYSDEVDDDTFLRYFYLPYVMVEIFFDYVDSVADQCASMKIPELKKVVRVLRDAKKDNDYLNRRHLGFNNSRTQQGHMEYFQNIYAKEIADDFKSIREMVEFRRPELKKDWVFLVSTVYHGMAFYRAAKRYGEKCDAVIDGIWGRATRSIVPCTADTAGKILPVCLGDCEGILRDSDIDDCAQRIYEMIEAVGFEGDVRCD